MEVIQLIVEGSTNQHIADELFISIETVKDHDSDKLPYEQLVLFILEIVPDYLTRSLGYHGYQFK